MIHKRSHWCGLALNPGDRVRTREQSRAALQLSDRSVIRLNERTTLEILPPRNAEKKRFGLPGGSVFFFNREKPADVEFDTPLAAGAIRGTEFLLEVAAADQALHLALIDGLVALQTQSGEVSVQRGEELRLAPGQPPQKTALLNATAVIQWALYYPAVLNPDDPLQAILLFGAFSNDGDTFSPQTATARTSSASVQVALDLASLAIGNGLTVAFLDPYVEGAGFDSLNFRAQREGVTFLDVTFVDAVAATAFFNDNVLLFDAFDPVGDGVLDLRFDMDLGFTGRDDYFSTNFLVGAAVVPLPGGVWLLGTAIGALGWVRHRRR